MQRALERGRPRLHVGDLVAERERVADREHAVRAARARPAVRAQTGGVDRHHRVPAVVVAREPAPRHVAEQRVVLGRIAAADQVDALVAIAAGQERRDALLLAQRARGELADDQQREQRHAREHRLAPPRQAPADRCRRERHGVPSASSSAPQNAGRSSGWRDDT
jgi:hypothetical protein